MKMIFKVLISGFIAINILSVFCLFYSYNGASVPDVTKATDVKRKPYQWTANMKEGFCWKRADENGHYNEFSNQSQNPEVLLMGSSHMQAIQMKNSENVGSLMNQQIPTYSIGNAGHFIYTCAENMEDALKTYKPTKYVVVETFTSAPYIESMKATLELDENPDVPSHSKIIDGISTYVPSAVELLYSLQDWKRVDDMAVEEEEVKVSDEEYEQVLSQFLDKLNNPVKESGCELILFYHQTLEMDREGNLLPRSLKVQKELDDLASMCKEKGIIFYDMTPDFIDYYEETSRLPYGFINTSPGQGHMNKYGHQLVANRLLQIIEERKG